MAQVLDRALCPVLVGRAAELEALEDALLAANRGEGQVVVLAGEAGMGKTRLSEELAAAARRGGTVVLEGSCSEAELALPYLPFLEAIGNHLAIADLEDLRERLGPVRREVAQLFPQLDPEAGHGDAGDPTQGRLRLFEALVALLRVPADEHGVLLIVEDVHWADASTRELLDYLTRRLRTTRVMVLATYRSDELHRRHPLLPLVQGWRRASTARIVELEPLTADGIARMVRAIFDTDEVSDEFRDFLFERSEGNPFVAEELLKAAIDRGDIYRTAEGWERRDLREVSLPRTVTDSVLMRLERLTEEDAAILQAAAVLGRSFSYHTLAAVAGPGEERVQEGLRLFVQQQLMEEEAAAGRYRFRHALTREAVYQDLIAPRRLALHARAAEALRAIPETPAAELAYHLLAAERRDEAIPVLRVAAAEAERRLGFREAVALYERLVPILADELERAEALCLQGRALYWAGDPPHAQALLEEGIPVLERHGRVQDGAHFRLVLGRCHWERSRPDRAQAEYERARDALEPLGASEDLAVAYVRLAAMRVFELDNAAAIALGERAREIALEAGAESAAIWADVYVGTALATTPARRDEGFAILQRASKAAIERDLPWLAAYALFNELVTAVEEGYGPRAALERLPLFREVAERMQNSPNLQLIEGQAYMELGEPEAADAALETLRQRVAAAGLTTYEAWSRRAHARVLSMLDRHDEATAMLPAPADRLERQDAIGLAAARLRVLHDAGDAERSLAEARGAIELLAGGTGGWPVHEARVADRAMEILVTGGALDDAEGLMRLAEKAGMPADDPFIRRLAGRRALAEGHTAGALEAFREAAETFRRAEYRDEEWRTRRLLAEALVAAGERDAAGGELRRVLAEAGERGHVAEARRAREALDALGTAAREAGPRPRMAKRSARAPAGGAPGQRTGPPDRPTEVVATVMFLDVRGYTASTAKRTPEDTVERLAALHRWAKREVERHHGVVDKFAGDAVMAVFNASGARLDHAVHALQAALAIRDKAAYAGMPVGIGIATGPAVVGRLTEGANISAVGETTNLAARLQGAAAAGEIVLSEEAHRRVRDWLAGRSLAAGEDALEVKGLDRPVVAFRLG